MTTVQVTLGLNRYQNGEDDLRRQRSTRKGRGQCCCCCSKGIEWPVEVEISYRKSAISPQIGHPDGGVDGEAGGG